MKFLGDHHIDIEEVFKNKCTELLQIKFETINICNIQCDFCRTSALAGKDQQESSLGIDNFKNIIDEAIDLGLQIVSFEGKGEPFLDPNFLEYLKYLVKKNLYIKIHTNLTFLNGSDIEYKSVFIDLIKNYIKISLITTLANNTDLNRIKKHIETLEEWNYLSKDITRLAARILIFNENKDTVQSYFEYCLQKNIFPRVQLFYNLGRAKALRKVYLSKNELRSIYKEFETIIKEKDIELELPTFPGYKSFPLYYTLTIDSNCNVKFYPEFDEKIKQNFLGNLQDSKLSELWMSKKAKLIRNINTHNTGKCIMCPQKKVGCYGDKIQTLILCDGEFDNADIFCWFNETENRNLPQQIIDKFNSELIEEINYNNILTIGVFNDWEKELRASKIENLKSTFESGDNNFRLSYVLPTTLEEQVISSMEPKFIKAYIKTENYISGKKKDDFSSTLMKTSKIAEKFIIDWAFEKNGELREGITDVEKDIFQDFNITNSDDLSIRDSMYVSQIVHKFNPGHPFGLIFITLPKSYLEKKENIIEKLNIKVTEFSNYLYEAILKSWYVRLSSRLEDMLENCVIKEINSLITNYLYCAFFLTNIEKNKVYKYYNEYSDNNYNYFINLNEFLKHLPFSLGNFIYDLIKLKIQTIKRWEAIDVDRKKTRKLEVSAKKSAIAAVMSRNMSHNYGSHSLVYLGKADNLRGEKYNKTNQLIITEDFNHKHNLY